MKSKQEEKYWNLRMKEEEKLKDEELRKRQGNLRAILYLTV